MKCPDCGQYSLTYDYERNGWICHVYNGFIPDEHMPRRPLNLKPLAGSTTRFENEFKALLESSIISVKEARELLGLARSASGVVVGATGEKLMKCQLRLGLKRPGKHRRKPSDSDARFIWPLWTHRLALNVMQNSFGLGCHPKHYDTGLQKPCYTMNYVTGVATWHEVDLPALPYLHGFIDMAVADMAVAKFTDGHINTLPTNEEP